MMMIFRRNSQTLRVRVALVAAAIGVASAACSPAADRGNRRVSDEEIPKLVVASSAPLATLDVTKAINSHTVASLAYEPLEYPRPNGTFVPGLAQEVSSTSTRLTYTLRSGARFSDGSPITPKDVTFTVERAMRAPTTGPLLRSVKSVHITGTDKVTVTLDRPDATVRGALAIVSGVLKRDYVQAHSEGFGAGGRFGPTSGPYRVASLTSGGLRFERNDRYWGTRPKPKKLEFTFISDPSTAQLAMRSGDVDAAILLDPGNARQYKSVPGATVHTDAGSTTSFISFDISTPPFDDVHVRRAIAHTVDRANLARAAFSGYADPLRSVLSSNQVASVSDAPRARRFLNGLPAYDFALDQARKELARSAYPRGFEVTVPTAPIVGFGETTLLALQENLKDIGIRLHIKTMSSEEWLAQLYSHRNLGMQLAFLTPSVSDPAGTLGLLVGKSNAKANGFNLANYAPAEVETALTVLLRSGDRDKRFAATKTILEAMADDVPYIPLVAPQFLLVTGDSVVYQPEDRETADITSALWVRGIRATVEP